MRLPEQQAVQEHLLEAADREWVCEDAWRPSRGLTLVGGALAYSVWFRGARALPSARIALLGVLSPLTAAVLGWVVLGQALSPLQIVGFVVALLGSLGGQLGQAGSRGPSFRVTQP